jgi:leucyl aminopeptidase
MTLQFSLEADSADRVDTACCIVGVFADGVPSTAASALDHASAGAIRQQIDSGDISGKLDSSTLLYAPAGILARRVLVLGLGALAEFDAARLRKVTLAAARAVDKLPASDAVCYLTDLAVPGLERAAQVRLVALALDQALYHYTATRKPRDATASINLGHVRLAGADSAQPTLDQAVAIAAGVRFARVLANLPPNICTPAYIAEQARTLAASAANVTCRTLDRAAMETLGFGALLAVARGSAHPPYLVVLEYRGDDAGQQPYAFVGKGVTFDAGGINLKPTPGMEEMKFDMGGAAGALGAFVAAVRLRLKLNLVCVVPTVENMPGGASYRPGDVLTSLSGQTIEVLNTDAEGRLILCDALTYTAQTFQPQVLIDVATLTGACGVALGKHASGLLSHDDALAAELIAAGETTLDRAWRLPLWDDYQSQLDSAFADMANIGGKSAGAITAACFLSRFTRGQRWAHLDIAGTAWDEGRKGLATGRPVALLTQWLIDRQRA